MTYSRGMGVRKVVHGYSDQLSLLPSVKMITLPAISRTSRIGFNYARVWTVYACKVAVVYNGTGRCGDCSIYGDLPVNASCRRRRNAGRRRRWSKHSAAH